jgi:6-phosphofructokinase 1
VEQAYAVGKAAVEMALAGKQALMPTIVRDQAKPYRWSIGEANLSEVANQEKKMPIHYITDNGFGITQDCRDYLQPLIAGESFPPFDDGLPRVAKLKNQLVEKKLRTEFEL